MPQNRTYMLPDGLIGQRIDVAVSKLAGISRHLAQQLIDEGEVVLNAHVCTHKSHRMEVGDIIDVSLPDPPSTEPEKTPADLPILYEDADIVVVNKPPGMAAHTGPGWDGPTVIGALLAAGIRVSTSGPVERKGIVHRLDAGTSGAMVVTKTERAYGVMKNAFRYRRVTKLYHAVVEGYPDPLKGTIEAAIGRAPGRQFKMAITHDGKPAISHYKTIEAMVGATLLEVNLQTGRTHQIRVHCEAIGHPVIGDPLYGHNHKLAQQLTLDRQWLHAVTLEFDHPVTQRRMTFNAPYTADLDHALEALRQV